ncbi:MAG: hypothetical protein IGS49_21330 [Chlorogloeopsis fritschii C42_A2020_084]|nr:hypothetical protein [Chlorogloeopsis fritschii]MBF2007915.1 hypothetical protein [Chlorogloeopsis fritschii C42_A2020_084]
MIPTGDERAQQELWKRSRLYNALPKPKGAQQLAERLRAMGIDPDTL